MTHLIAIAVLMATPVFTLAQYGGPTGAGSVGASTALVTHSSSNFRGQSVASGQLGSGTGSAMGAVDARGTVSNETREGSDGLVSGGASNQPSISGGGAESASSTGLGH